MVGSNNKGADQPASARRLVSAFVVRMLQSQVVSRHTSTVDVKC